MEEVPQAGGVGEAAAPGDSFDAEVGVGEQFPGQGQPAAIDPGARGQPAGAVSAVGRHAPAALVGEIRERGITSVAIPPLGCGLGGLNRPQVRALIDQAFTRLPDVVVLLYEPAGAPASAEMVKTAMKPEMTVARAALVALMRRYLAAVMDPFVSLLEVHNCRLRNR